MIVSSLTGVSSNATASKKPFSLDFDYLLVAVLFLVVLFSSRVVAFSVDAPLMVEVNNTAVFYVDLVNDSSNLVDLKVNFYSPADATVVAPKQLAPNSKTSAKITIVNNFKDERQIMGLVEASFGTQIITKDVNLLFTPNRSVSQESVLAGLFSFGTTITEFSAFNLVDWAIFIILVLVCAVLLVSFIARVKRRA